MCRNRHILGDEFSLMRKDNLGFSRIGVFVRNMRFRLEIGVSMAGATSYSSPLFLHYSTWPARGTEGESILKVRRVHELEVSSLGWFRGRAGVLPGVPGACIAEE